jgi:trehalose synthase
LNEVEVGTAPIDRYKPLLDHDVWLEFDRSMRELAERLRGRRLWNLNSTAQGGGVAELLASLIPYDRGLGIDEHWLTIEGSPAFFNVTKRIHTLLHGVTSDGSEITNEERREYGRTMERNALALTDIVASGDVVILHDPQSAGLVPALRIHGAHVIWRSHVGVDEPNDIVRAAWSLLQPFLDPAEAFVFSRPNYAWEGLDPKRVHIIPPCIDAFADKNRELGKTEVDGILSASGIIASSNGGGTGLTSHQVEMTGPPLPADAQIVLQVSRWDRLKDAVGVLEAFTRHIAPKTGSYLVLAGPAATSVRDDPEQPEVVAELASRHKQLPDATRQRVRIAQLPMEDEHENAVMVNALQRRADVVVQKSLAEGFGLTVAEAMWKSRPVVASRVGGIEDQIEDGKSGLLTGPRDQVRFGKAVVELLLDRNEAMRLGDAARERVAHHFLGPRHLMQQGELVRTLIE